MLLSMYCPNGRVGKTTTSLAFAHEAQSNYGIDTCVLEFDFSPGDISSILKLDSAKNILDAADGNFDIAIQKPMSEEFDVIVAGYPDYPEQLKSEDVIRIVEELEERYSLVIVDIQPNFIEQVIDILQLSDKIVLVLNNEEQGVTRVLNNIDWGIKSGYMDESKFEILINKFNKKDKINYISEAQLQYPLLTTIPTINNFKGYTDERFTRYMGELISIFFPEINTKPNKKGGLFAGLFGKRNNKKNSQPTPMQLPAPKRTSNINDDIVPKKPFGSIAKDPIIENKDSFENISELIKGNTNNQGEDDMLDLGDDIFKEASMQPILKVEKTTEEKEQDCSENNVHQQDSKLSSNIKSSTINDDIFELVEPTAGAEINDTINTIANDIEPIVYNKEVNSTTIENELDKPTIPNTDLSVENINLHSEDNSAFGIQEIINSFIAENTKKLNKVVNENITLKNEYKTLTKSNTILERTISNLREEKLSLEKNIRELTNTIIDQEKELKELKNKNASINNELKNKLDYIKNKIVELNALL